MVLNACYTRSHFSCAISDQFTAAGRHLWKTRGLRCLSESALKVVVEADA